MTTKKDFTKRETKTIAIGMVLLSLGLVLSILGITAPVGLPLIGIGVILTGIGIKHKIFDTIHKIKK